jgi:hypothetical protein
MAGDELPRRLVSSLLMADTAEALMAMKSREVEAIFILFV